MKENFHIEFLSESQSLVTDSNTFNQKINMKIKKRKNVNRNTISKINNFKVDKYLGKVLFEV